MAKRNYKDYADLGRDPNCCVGVLTILDIGAGPKFVRRAELPSGVDR